MSEVDPGAFDRLVRSPPTQVANFALSSNIVRSSAASAGESLAILPERGAMPIFWAADGYTAEEPSMLVDGVIRLPIGSYDFENEEGEVRKGTLRREQKATIVNQFHEDISEADRLLLIDEVQKGGTITEAVSILDRQRRVGLEDDPKRMYVIAAQDSRKKVAEENKKEIYQKMIAGNMEGISATVIPMPLIATDSDALLNQLWYPGQSRHPVEPRPPIEIRDNPEAQLIFRLLGLAARNREALEDTSVLDENLFSLPLGERSAQRVDEWRGRFLGILRSVADTRQ